MDPKQALEALKEIDEVPADVIEALEGSSLRKQISEWETRWREEAEPAINYKAKQENLPKRKEALKRVGVDYDAQKPFGQEALDAIPADKLDDLEFVATYVQEKGFETSLSPEEAKSEGRPPAAKVVDYAASAGSGTPPSPDKDAEFYAELDAVPDGDKEGVRQVLVKYGKAAQEA